ncbi:hypothetical protein BOTBODRAFT_117264, partial [Botryobasidium botryosum FD-172 SS1]
MVNAIDLNTWRKHKTTLTALSRSPLKLHMANNYKVALRGRWIRTVRTAGIQTAQVFEVYEANGSFKILLGKLWLIGVRAIHDYGDDTIKIKQGEETAILGN